MKKVLGILLAAFALAAASPAVIAFSSFGPGDSYNAGSLTVITGPDLTTPQRKGYQFSSTATGALDSIRFPLRWLSGDTNLHWAIHEDNADTMGAVLASGDFVNSSTTSVIVVQDWTGSTPVLNAGSVYWLEMWGDLNGSHGWHLNDQGLTTTLALSNDHGQNFDYLQDRPTTAFEVNVVPEPATLIALGLGAAALARRRRRKL